DPLPAGAVARLGTVRFRQGDTFLSSFAVLDDKTILTTESSRSALCIWDVGTGRLVREIGTAPVTVRLFARSANGKYFAVAGMMNENGDLLTSKTAIRVVAADTGKEVRTIVRE